MNPLKIYLIIQCSLLLVGILGAIMVPNLKDPLRRNLTNAYLIITFCSAIIAIVLDATIPG